MLLYVEGITLDCVTFWHIYNFEFKKDTVSVCMLVQVVLLTSCNDLLHMFICECQACLSQSICWRETSLEKRYKGKLNNFISATLFCNSYNFQDC
jgi:hypothetical protein